jgi:hypothetical protein
MTGEPGFTDPFVAATLTQYGAAMIAVQAWEGALAALVGTVSIKPSQGKPVPLERAVRKAFRRSWKLMHNSTASELRNLLRDLVDGEIVTDALVEEISALNEWRNFLAHSYLRSRLFEGSTLKPNPTHIVELFQVGQAFSKSSERIVGATQSALARLPKSAPPESVRQVIEQLGRDIVNHQPAPFGTPPKT